jgi:hypothetical protein
MADIDPTSRSSSGRKRRIEDIGSKVGLRTQAYHLGMRVGALLVFFAFLLPQPIAAQPIPFDICAESTTWTRPTPEVQAKIWNDGRYRDFGRTDYAWTHDFIVIDVPESASGHYHLRNLSGLWTDPPAVLDKCYSDRNGRLNGYEWIEVWVLLHRVTQVTHDANTYTITVEPLGRGFQSVFFRRLNPVAVLRFVTRDGQELERWNESSPSRWFNNEVPPGTVIINTKGQVIRK